MGKQMKDANLVISGLDQSQIKQIEDTGHFTLDLGGESFELSLDDFVISSEDIPGWQVASDGNLTVALDVTLDDELIAEGTAREIVNRIQNIRKDKEFEVTDRIIVHVQQHPAIIPAIKSHAEYIQNEVLADQILLEEKVQGEEVELFDEVNITMNLQLV